MKEIDEAIEYLRFQGYTITKREGEYGVLAIDDPDPELLLSKEGVIEFADSYARNIYE